MDGLLPTRQTLGRYLRQCRESDELDIADVAKLLRMLRLVGLSRPWPSVTLLPDTLTAIEAGHAWPNREQMLSLKLVLTFNIATARRLVREELKNG